MATATATRHLRYRTVDFGPPTALEEATERVRRRQCGGSQARSDLSRYRSVLRREEELERRQAAGELPAVAAPVAAAVLPLASPRIPNLATLQKDLASPRGPVGGPCYLTGQRTGFLSMRQAANPHRPQWTSNTKAHVAPYYCLIRGASDGELL